MSRDQIHVEDSTYLTSSIQESGNIWSNLLYQPIYSSTHHKNHDSLKEKYAWSIFSHTNIEGITSYHQTVTHLVIGVHDLNIHFYTSELTTYNSFEMRKAVIPSPNTHDPVTPVFS